MAGAPGPIGTRGGIAYLSNPLIPSMLGSQLATGGGGIGMMPTLGGGPSAGLPMSYVNVGGNWIPYFWLQQHYPRLAAVLAQAQQGIPPGAPGSFTTSSALPNPFPAGSQGAPGASATPPPPAPAPAAAPAPKSRGGGEGGSIGGGPEPGPADTGPSGPPGHTGGEEANMETGMGGAPDTGGGGYGGDIGAGGYSEGEGGFGGGDQSDSSGPEW
jgi:hypothetical protein